jgi:hypothetical protein
LNLPYEKLSKQQLQKINKIMEEMLTQLGEFFDA